jgi:hypothetical protein
VFHWSPVEYLLNTFNQANAAEHVTAVWMAMKNKMELTIGICVGSSIVSCKKKVIASATNAASLLANHCFRYPSYGYRRMDVSFIVRSLSYP